MSSIPRNQSIIFKKFNQSFKNNVEMGDTKIMRIFRKSGKLAQRGDSGHSFLNQFCDQFIEGHHSLEGAFKELIFEVQLWQESKLIFSRFDY